MSTSDIAKRIAEKPRGILAMDESTGTIQKRLEGVGMESTEETRRDYRSMLASTPGLGDFVSGAIMFEETLLQSNKEGVRITKLLLDQDIVPGIKVDKGAKDNASFGGRKITEGLEGLPERLAAYKEEGAVFAKWRAVLTVEDSPENTAAVDENMKRLAEYARMCLEAGIVPIVEPEVLMDGTHDIDGCFKQTQQALTLLYKHMEGLDLSGTLLKPNMVHPGKDSGQSVNAQLVAEKTLAVLQECVPAEVPGIMFLSGGLSDEDSVNFLAEMNKTEGLPWNVSFSYGRALQQAPLKVFSQEYESGDVTKAQETLLQRAKACSQATQPL